MGGAFGFVRVDEAQDPRGGRLLPTVVLQLWRKKGKNQGGSPQWPSRGQYQGHSRKISSTRKESRAS